MPVLIVEDGTGLVDANSYVTLEEAQSYNDNHGNSVWGETSPDDAKIVALIRGTSYIDTRYGTLFNGRKKNGRAQALEWPRVGASDAAGQEILPDEVPVEIKRATIEAALRELQEPSSLQPDYTQSSRVVREKVDVLEVQYSDDSTLSEIPTITVIDDLLSSLLGAKSNSTVTFVNRA